MPGKMWGAFSNVHDIPNDNIISERHGHDGPGGVCVSYDFGASWKPEAQGLPLRPVTSIVLDPRSLKNTRTLYAGVFMEGVYKSTDDGKTRMLKKTGLWLTRDNGQTWEAFDDLPFSNIQRVSFDPSDDAVMFVTTFGGSVWRGPAAPQKGGSNR